MKRSVPIPFTELLYVVVIGTAMTRIDKLALTETTILLILALVIIFDDYLLYHHTVERIPSTGKNEILIFWTDMMVLAAWYALSLAAQASSVLFWLWAGIFFTTTSLWEILFAHDSLRRRLLRHADLVPIVTSFALSLAAAFLHWPYFFCVGVFLVAFAWCRAPDWAELWRRR